MQLKFKDKILQGPLLIPSISSFETQVSGTSALKLHSVLQEPISLVSAYDVYENDELIESINQYRSNGGIIFIDSGGYEDSRIKKYLSSNVLEFCIKNKMSWTEEKYKKAIEAIDFDLAASFDVFKFHDEAVDAFCGRIIKSFESQKKYLGDAIVPVIHLREENGNGSFSINESVTIIESIAGNFQPEFIAIPERELGHGLVERYRNIKIIVDELRNNNHSTKLHILGCGNPFTFAVLAHAGIGLADGLEWCRTKYSKSFHLHHFQHFDSLHQVDINFANIAAQYFEESLKANGTLSDSNKTLVALCENLSAQHDFISKVNRALENNNLLEFLNEHYPITDDIRELFI